MTTSAYASKLLPRLEPLVSGADICARLGISRQTLRRLVRRKQFPQPIEIARMRYAWRATDVDAWVAAGGLRQFRSIA